MATQSESSLFTVKNALIAAAVCIVGYLAYLHLLV